MAEFIQELIKVQKARGLTDGDMAEKVGITRQWYFAIRTGKARPSVRTLRNVSMAFPSLSKSVRQIIDAMFK